jgi:predicted RNase H-like HicB family nuclease
MKYKIALRETDEGYSVSVPGLPGCWSQGSTEEEALQARDELLDGAVVREVEVTSLGSAPGLIFEKDARKARASQPVR